VTDSGVKEEKPLIFNGEAMCDLIRPLLAEGRICRFVAGGMSMYPFIRDRDCVTIAPLDGKKPELGDVLAFFGEGSSSVVIHRMIRKRNGGYLMKGDNCRCPDGLIPPDRIGGILVKLERGGRTVRLGMGPEIGRAHV
jgi:hypothetical protein